MIETWRPVPHYEGRYEVSDYGRVRSLGFYSENRWNTRTWRAGRMLKLTSAKSGHLTVGLVDADAAHRTYKVHRLVLLAFVGEAPPGKPDGLHRDDDPSNNHVSNLRWGDKSENSNDAVTNGGHTQSSKTTCGLGHDLVEPNLVPSSSKRGYRACQACKITHATRHSEALRAARGVPRLRTNRTPSGFLRRIGESFEDEANRRYEHIMATAEARRS